MKDAIIISFLILGVIVGILLCVTDFHHDDNLYL